MKTKTNGTAKEVGGAAADTPVYGERPGKSAQVFLSASTAALCRKKGTAKRECFALLQTGIPAPKPRRRMRVPRHLISLCLPWLMFFSLNARGELQVVSGKDPVRVFSGDARRFPVIWHNPGAAPAKADVVTRLFQASSSTVVYLQSTPWKRLEVLPGQTVTESAVLNFPTVRSETPYVVQWLESSNRIFGATEVLVYPPDLLRELNGRHDAGLLGVFDPENQIMPSFKKAGVDFVDLGESAIEDFKGQLAILAPFQSKHSELTNRIWKMARNGAAVLWFQASPAEGMKMKPSFYTIPTGKGAIVIAQPGLISNLAGNPESQLNLLRLSFFALKPEPFSLPNPLQ